MVFVAGEGVIVDKRVKRGEFWIAPVIMVASSCQHIVGERHRVLVMDLMTLVADLAGAPGERVPLGGIQMGRFGLVLKGYAATDIWAIQRNILWEDEHCMHCCGGLLRFVDQIHDRVLVRCGPTIGVEWNASREELTTADARRITDEYWTD